MCKKVASLFLATLMSVQAYSQEISQTTTLPDTLQLGFGYLQKSMVTQSIAKVSVDHFNKGMYTAGDQVIEGKIAGLQLIPSGDPIGSMTFRLRGASIGFTAPLIVVDGVPIDLVGGYGNNPLNILHPADIEDIVLLKDASASALYGIRGAGGVLVINSKQGQTPNLKITYDGSYGVSLLTNKPDFLSPSEFRKAIQEYAPFRSSTLGNATTNWMKEVTRIAQNTQHTISIGQRKKNSRLYSSLNYFHNEGVLRFSQHEKINFLFNVEQKLLNDNLTLRLSTKNNFVSNLFGRNIFETAAAFDPTQPVKTSTGAYFEWPNSIAPGNPVAEQDQIDNSGKSWRTFSTISAAYMLPFVKGLSIGVDYSFDYDDTENLFITKPESRYGSFNGGTLSMSDFSKTNTFLNAFALVEKTMNKHQVNVRAGVSTQTFASKFTNLSGTQLAYTNGEYKPTANLFEYTSDGEYALASAIGNVSYSYANKYFLNSSVRVDKTSSFSDEGVFPAVSVGWQIRNEKFASTWSSKINELKIRAGYGITGFDQLPGTGVAGLNLKWQEMSSLNFGLDGSFYNRKVSTTLDFYERKDTDIIFGFPLPPNGNLVYLNGGEITNRGIETTLSILPVNTKNLVWNISLNASYSKNKIVDFPYSYQTGQIDGDVGRTIQVLQEGNSVGAFYVFSHKQNADGSLVLDTNGDGVQSNIEMYEDINRDGVINEQDLITYKNSNPNVLIGFTSSTTYKKWDISVTLKGAFGHSVYNNVASANGYLGRLTAFGANSNIHTSAVETNFKTQQLLSNYYVQNASFVRVPNLVIGYTFNDFSFGRVRAYLQSQNVLTLTKYKGLDPEIGSGIDTDLYPRSITIMAGASVTFN